MYEKPSLILRIAIGKAIGFSVGLIGLITLPYFVPDVDWMLRFGVLFWYTTIGAFIGVFGVFSYHPILHLPLPWWFRSALIGGWMNFVLVLFAYDLFSALMAEISLSMFGDAAVMVSPFWFVLEGIIIGLVIGYVATRYGGEGPETAGR